MQNKRRSILFSWLRRSLPSAEGKGSARRGKTKKSTLLRQLFRCFVSFVGYSLLCLIYSGIIMRKTFDDDEKCPIFVTEKRHLGHSSKFDCARFPFHPKKTKQTGLPVEVRKTIKQKKYRLWKQ